MNRRRLPVLSLLLVSGLTLSTAPNALAQHSHGSDAQPGHKDDGHSHAPAKAAADYAAAVREIGERMASLDGLIAKGDLEEAHEQSDAIGALAKSLGALALKAGSGVDKAQIKDINKAGKALADAADGVHEAGEKKDVAAAKAAYAEMKKQSDALAAFAPAKYFCPMHCEGAKTYDKPGKCPVCHMNLKKLTSEEFSVSVQAAGGTKVEAGKPADLVFTLKDPMGMAVKDVEIVHEKPLHLLMVSSDLSWFAHEHPELRPDGTFTLRWTAPAGGEYTMFHDFTPKEVGMQVVPVKITVAGAARPAVALNPDADKPKTVEGYTVTLDTGGPVSTGRETRFSYTITKDGKPVDDLTPYLGAMGHLVIISEDRKEFVHSHPHEGEGHASGGPKVDFEAHFSVPGTYKGWAQFNVGTAAKEQILTVPFTFTVAKGEGGGEAKPHEHGGGGKKEGGHDHK